MLDWTIWDRKVRLYAWLWGIRVLRSGERDFPYVGFPESRPKCLRGTPSPPSEVWSSGSVP